MRRGTIELRIRVRSPLMPSYRDCVEEFCATRPFRAIGRGVAVRPSGARDRVPERFQLGSADEDEDVDRVDQRVGLVGARADLAEDFPAFELRVCSFAWAAEPGVGGVDGLLRVRERGLGVLRRRRCGTVTAGPARAP
jgi:hypothetical protein